MALTRIVIFAKAPVPGAVKTRLIPALGDNGAARLASEMLADTAAAAVAANLSEPELCVVPPPGSAEWAPFVPPGVRVTDQGSGDLGERLARAAGRVLAAGERPLLIGSDCPAIDAKLLRAAADRLDTHDAIIHPAQDGGYVLLGLTRFDPSLFSGIVWSSASVAAETIDRIHALGWSLQIGETLRDIDRPEDFGFS
jgi:rSAM/selenodomain-associated transferase 1